MLTHKREETRQKILETSLRLFVRQGYGGTTIRDIAREAGISTGLLFHYYASKRALLEAHLALANEGMRAALKLLAADEPPLQIFLALATVTTAGLREPMARQLYSLVNQPLPPELTSHHQVGEQVVGASVRTIIRGQQLGEIRPGDPVALAFAFWGAVQGLALMLGDQEDAPLPDPGWLVDMLRPRRADA